MAVQESEAGAGNASETITEKAAGSEKSLIAGMMQTYLQELSPFTDQKPGGNGRYQYPFLELYWHEQGRHPLVIRNGRAVIGFALVRQVKGGTTMAEFFIKPDHRKQGHGRVAAQKIFHMFPGKWAVRQQLMNASAQTFWRRVISEVDSKYSERIETTRDGRSGTVQRFEIPIPLNTNRGY
jgi:predicted acetyltransferase